MSFAEFDAYVKEHGYTPEQVPQAFADWLASLTGEHVVGISEDGAVEGQPGAPPQHPTGTATPD